MKTVCVQYQVKPEAAAENEERIRAVFAALARDKPPGLRYQTFKSDDGVSFVHIASYTAEGPSPLLQVEAFRQFVAGVKDRCAVQPVTTPGQTIGIYEGLQLSA